jgi:hypothetical protein
LELLGEYHAQGLLTVLCGGLASALAHHILLWEARREYFLGFSKIRNHRPNLSQLIYHERITNYMLLDKSKCSRNCFFSPHSFRKERVRPFTTLALRPNRPALVLTPVASFSSD